MKEGRGFRDFLEHFQNKNFFPNYFFLKFPQNSDPKSKPVSKLPLLFRICDDFVLFFCDFLLLFEFREPFLFEEITL